LGTADFNDPGSNLPVKISKESLSQAQFDDYDHVSLTSSMREFKQTYEVKPEKTEKEDSV
jgi:hypothetical protein